MYKILIAIIAALCLIAPIAVSQQQSGPPILPLPVNTASVASWSTGTAQNTVVTITNGGLFEANQLTLSATANVTAGAITFQGTKADGTDETIPVAQVINPNTLAVLTNPYTLTTSRQDFLILTQGYQTIKAKLTTAITTSSGAGTTVISNTNLPYNPVVAGLLNPLVAGSAIIGKVGVDQTTPGTTNAVSLTAVNATALGTPTNFGTTPGAVVVPGVNASLFYGTVAAVGDPCQLNAKTTVAISQTANTTVVTGTSSKKTYICSFALIANAAENVALITGTGSACVTTQTAALIGSTTTASGLNLAANGGLTLGNGAATIAGGLGSNADNVCLMQSGSVKLAGVLTYVQQ